MSIESVKDLMATYQAKIDIVNAYRKSMAKTIETEFKGIFADYFKKYQEVSVIWWSQYTPWFNDGDPCVFGMNDVIISDEKNKNSNHYYDFNDLTYSKTLKDKTTLNINNEAHIEFAKLLHKLEDIWYELYGDHISVKVTPEGIEVTEYEHD